MKHIEFYGDFKPQGCFNRSASLKQMAATLGASVQDGELFAKMANHNAITVSGMNNVRTNAKNLYLMIITWTFTYDVGVVGWATGSPHGRELLLPYSFFLVLSLPRIDSSFITASELYSSRICYRTFGTPKVTLDRRSFNRYLRQWGR